MFRNTSAVFLGWLLLAISSAPVAQDTLDRSLLEYYREAVYQIVVIDRETGNKRALGSGFQVSSSGLLVSNYHVISDFVFEPAATSLRAVDSNGRNIPLTLIDVDVINDLALLQASEVGEQFLQISSRPYRRGDTLYALGNPHGFGMLSVEGAYNGIAENSFIDKILYSGSLNAGMSGGPAIDTGGNLVGVNVATAGSQLSFLVPASKVIALLEQNHQPTETDGFKHRIATQIVEFQTDYIDYLLAQDWPVQPIGENASVIGEMAPDLSCWGGGNQDREDRDMLILELSCANGNQTYLNNRFNTGILHYAFFYYESLNLTADQFHEQIGHQNFRPDNAAPERFMTRYQCEQAYLEPHPGDAPGFRQVGICFRAYKELPNLYDALYYQFSGQEQRVLVSHFTLAGITRETALLFSQQFLQVGTWN